VARLAGIEPTTLGFGVARSANSSELISFNLLFFPFIFNELATQQTFSNVYVTSRLLRYTVTQT
jgi:hypothetical protein